MKIVEHLLKKKKEKKKEGKNLDISTTASPASQRRILTSMRLFTSARES